MGGEVNLFRPLRDQADVEAAMAVMGSKIDSLLGLSFQTSDFTDADIQSWTDRLGLLGLATITATTSGARSSLSLGGTMMTIVGIDDMNSNLVTAEITGNGIDQLETLYVAGFASNALFLSTEPLSRRGSKLGYTQGELVLRGQLMAR